MIDQRLRDLESRFQSTGSAEDELAWHRARIQAGLLTEAMISLAAWLGSEVASELCASDPGRYADLVWWEDREFEKAGAYLADYGSEAMTRVLLASCWARPETHRLSKNGPRRRALWALEESLLDPDTPSRDTLIRFRARYRPNTEPTSWDRSWQRYRGDLLSQVIEFQFDPSADRLRAAWSTKGFEFSPLGTHLEARMAVLPWALGVGDPLRERVAARRT